MMSQLATIAFPAHKKRHFHHSPRSWRLGGGLNGRTREEVLTSNKPMESQNDHEFDHNMPTHCEPLSIKLLGSLPFIEAAKPFIIQKKKTPTTAGSNNGIDNKGENKEAMLRTYNLHNKAPHNKLRDSKNLPSSCAFLSSNSLGNLPFIETPKPFPIRKKENIKTNNCIKIPADISEFTVLDSDETPKTFPIRRQENIKTNNCIKIPADISEFIVLDSDERSSENANIEFRFFFGGAFWSGPRRYPSFRKQNG